MINVTDDLLTRVLTNIIRHSISLQALAVIFTRAIILSKIQELFKKLFNYLVQVC